MVAVAPLPIPTPPRRVPMLSEISLPSSEDGDQRFLMHGVSWDEYLAFRKLFDHRASLRLTYCEGTLELMSPSPAHEDFKTRIARLLELWAVVRRVRVHGFGSTTYRRKAAERGLEPDECYYVGDILKKKRPDIAIEVVITSGGIDKLDVYRGLEVPEVWIWRGDRISVHRLRKSGYVETSRSVLLHDLDLAELATFVLMPDQADAAEAYFAHLQRAPRRR